MCGYSWHPIFWKWLILLLRTAHLRKNRWKSIPPQNPYSHKLSFSIDCRWSFWGLCRVGRKLFQRASQEKTRSRCCREVVVFDILKHNGRVLPLWWIIPSLKAYYLLSRRKLCLNSFKPCGNGVEVRANLALNRLMQLLMQIQCNHSQKQAENELFGTNCKDKSTE